MSTIFLQIFSYAYLLAPQKSPLCLETMSQFAERVIPDESDCGGRDPVSSGLPLFPWIPDIPTSSDSGMTGTKKAGFTCPQRVFQKRSSRAGLCAGHLFYPGHHFSYYTIVMPDESA